jgi:uncharacterized protein DUF1638
LTLKNSLPLIMTSEPRITRVHVIACPVFKPELEVLAPAAPTKLDIGYLEMGLHDQPAKTLQSALQDAVDQATAGSYDAIAIAYGLCNRGIVGLQARTLPVVVPRAHDCIGLLLGSTECYLAQLDACPGTYFQSPGWLSNSLGLGQIRSQNLPFMPGVTLDRAELVARYGADNAEFLLEQFAGFTRYYERLAYIETPVPACKEWEQAARDLARSRGWRFEPLAGNLQWLKRLLHAEWDPKEFLVLKPGERVALRHDSRLIEAERV